MKKVEDNSQNNKSINQPNSIVNYPIRVLDFNKFKNVTEGTFLTDDELNLLGSLHEKDLTLADLEFLVALRVAIKYNIKQYLSVTYDTSKIKKDNYNLIVPQSDSYERPFNLVKFLDKYRSQGKTSIYRLHAYKLIDTVYVSSGKLGIIITKLGMGVVNEFLNSEKVDPLMVQLINKVK